MGTFGNINTGDNTQINQADTIENASQENTSGIVDWSELDKLVPEATAEEISAVQVLKEQSEKPAAEQETTIIDKALSNITSKKLLKGVLSVSSKILPPPTNLVALAIKELI